MTTTTRLQARMRRLPAPGLDAQVEFSPGSMRDYAALCEHHYRADRPATCTRVLALHWRRCGVVGRFVGRRSETQTVGVLVESLASLNCRLRDGALGDRYRTLRDLRARAAALNADLRCISRVVVHPQWRGLGLAVRLVRAALASATTPLTEALAAMGHVNPFFERAGMTAYRRPPHPFDQRLADALAAAGFQPCDLAMAEATWRRIDALPDPPRRWLLDELARWCRKTTRQSDTGRLDPVTQLGMAQRRLSCEPVYYLHDNRATQTRVCDPPPNTQ